MPAMNSVRPEKGLTQPNEKHCPVPSQPDSAPAFGWVGGGRPDLGTVSSGSSDAAGKFLLKSWLNVEGSSRPDALIGGDSP